MNNVAPVCPVSRGQPPADPPTRLTQVAPIATDLASLIRSINITTDVLRQITTSLTINNTWLPQAQLPPPTQGVYHYAVSPYPDWYQAGMDTVQGYVYGKNAKTGQKDPSQKALVVRIKSVTFFNRNGNEVTASDNFVWKYNKPLDEAY